MIHFEKLNNLNFTPHSLRGELDRVPMPSDCTGRGATSGNLNKKHLKCLKISGRNQVNPVVSTAYFPI